MHLSLLSLCQWLNDSPFSTALREGDYPFPIIETIHILAVAFSVGVIMWVDLRLLDIVMRVEPASDIIGQLEPWAIGGFIVMFLSGSLLFLAEPMKCYTTTAFRIKAVLLLLAGLNVWYFHGRIYRDFADWGAGAVTPWRAKLVGLASLLLWFGIIIAGRWTAYQQ